MTYCWLGGWSVGQSVIADGALHTERTFCWCGEWYQGGGRWEQHTVLVLDDGERGCTLMFVCVCVPLGSGGLRGLGGGEEEREGGLEGKYGDRCYC